MSDCIYSSGDQGRLRAVVPDLLRYRGLLLDLVSKELRARYRNAMIGFFWAVLQPLLLTLILAFVFTVVFRVGGRGGVRQTALEILAKLIFWQFLSGSLIMGANSLLDNQQLVKKVHFPRETIPLSIVLNALVNLGIGFVVLLVLHVVLAGAPSWGAVWIPFLFVIQFVMVVGLALLFAAANVYFRDVAYLLEVVLAFGFYASPILYPLEKVAEGLAGQPWLYALYRANPMAGLLTAYRDALIDGRLSNPQMLLWPAVFAVLSLLAGAAVFRRCAPRFADHL